MAFGLGGISNLSSFGSDLKNNLLPNIGFSKSKSASGSSSRNGSLASANTIANVAGLIEDEYANGLSSYYGKFRKHRNPSIIDYAETGYFYVFMTKPDLNFNAANMKALDLARYPKINLIKQMLSRSEGGVGGALIPLVTNLATSAPVLDINAEAITGYESFTGYGMKYGGKNHARVMGDFNINFLDLAGTPILSMHEVWQKYYEYALDGFVTRSETNQSANILDYAASLYVMVTEPDGETLTYWAKYTGVFPTGIPWSAIGADSPGNHSLVTPSIPYAFTYMEENDMEIIRDFIQVAGNLVSTAPSNQLYTSASKDRPLNGGAGGAAAPGTIFEKYTGVTIQASTSNTGGADSLRYLLKFR